ncbi:class I SAM-dependent methyltransferase, partial [bacterium]|nr:class I SAM-dependent methyltransferase [bacterium]
KNYNHLHTFYDTPDLDENALMAGQKLSDEKKISIRFEAGSANCIPLPDETVDYIVIRKALQYFSPLADCIGEVHRVLKPGGKFFIIKHINFPVYPLYYFLKQGNRDFLNKKGYYAHLNCWISSVKIVKTLKKYKFSHSTIIPTDFMGKDISKLKPVFIRKILAPFALQPFIVSVK